MSKPILNTEFWKTRLEEAEQRYQALFHCSPSAWAAIERRHRQILAKYIRPTDGVLDAGCGYGRLLDLLPKGWKGQYLGIDLSPDFVRIAQEEHPEQKFILGELLQTLPQLEGGFDWAICISMRPMITGNLGEGYWQKVQTELHRLADRILLLEYRTEDEGEVIEK